MYPGALTFLELGVQLSVLNELPPVLLQRLLPPLIFTIPCCHFSMWLTYDVTIIKIFSVTHENFGVSVCV